MPLTTPPGAYNLVAIANGIPSDPILVEIGTQDIEFLLQEPEFGGGQIAAQINLSGAPAVYQTALFVAIEGYKLSDLGITDTASLSNPGRKPTVHSPEPRMTYTYSGAAEAGGHHLHGAAEGPVPVPGFFHRRQPLPGHDLFSSGHGKGQHHHHGDLQSAEWEPPDRGSP